MFASFHHQSRMLTLLCSIRIYHAESCNLVTSEETGLLLPNKKQPFISPPPAQPIKRFHPMKGNPDCRIREIFPVESGILSFVIRNTAQGIRYSHLKLEARIQFSLTKTGIQCAESGIQKASIQNPGLSWIPSREAKGWPHTLHASYSVFCIAQIVTLIR